MVVISAPLGTWCFLVISLTWKYAGHSVANVSELFSQMQMLITATQAVIAFAVGVAVMYSAKVAADGVRHATQRNVVEAHRHRVRRALAFSGAAVDVASHAGMLARLQESGLRQKFLTPRSQEELRLVTWQGLTGAVSAAAGALQHLRYSEDEVVDRAEHLFRVITNIVRASAAGDIATVDQKIDQIGTGVRDFENIVQRLDPRRESLRNPG